MQNEIKIRLHTPFLLFLHFIFQKRYMFRLSSAIIRRMQSKAKTQILKQLTSSIG